MTRRRIAMEVLSMVPHLRQFFAAVSLVTAFALVSGTLHAVTKSMRIMLLVDSSDGSRNMVNEFRAGLNAFVDALPEDAEVTIISTGRNLRIRVPVTTDRAKLHAAVNGYTYDGGGNTFLETMLEADERFMKKATDKSHVIVILTTDNGESRYEPRYYAYNNFMNDFLRRGGLAHAIVVRGENTGPVTELVDNLVSNTGGVVETFRLPTVVAARMKALGARLTASYKAAQ
jgi:von Willebrand factor type A domain